MLLNKKRVKVEKILFPFIYMVLYRTKIGLKLMDKIAKKYPRIVGVFAYLSIIFGFLGMIVIVALLAEGVYSFLFAGAPPPVAPLFPGVKTVPGLPVLSFFHWIIAIFILATVHEFSHGLVSRLYNVNVKSSGFAIFSFLLPVIPAAFVEPDEEELNAKSKKEQLGVLAAGSFANFITMLVFLLLLTFVLAPAMSSTIYSEGVIIASVSSGYAANLSGINAGEQILKINDAEIKNVDDFFESTKEIKFDDQIEIITNVSSYSLTATSPPESFASKIMFWQRDKGYVGISISPIIHEYKEGFQTLGNILNWILLLFFWIYAANLGVGLFNLLPMGPLDGGKMSYIACLKFFKKENTAKKVWIGVSLFCLALIVISLMPFFARFFSYIFSTLIGLF